MIGGQEEGEIIPCLLGVKLRSDLRWVENTDYICKRGYARLWMLRRLKALGAKQTELVDLYEKQVRSLLELAVPVWHPGLTKIQTRDIERVQKISFRIILGPKYSSYKEACQYLCAETLEERRQKLCLKFAQKNLKSEHSLFKKLTPSVRTRNHSNLVQEYKCRTNRYQKSSLPYLAKLLNNHQKTK